MFVLKGVRVASRVFDQENLNKCALLLNKVEEIVASQGPPGNRKQS